MAKLTLANVSNIGGNPTSAATTLNNNNDLVETALENTLSRDGTTPNTMSADIDMNGNDLLNVGSLDAESLTVNGSIILPGDDISSVNFVSLSAQLNSRLGTWNVLDYGAGPDKTARENTDSIQACIDAAGNAGGGIVRVPYVDGGIYEITVSASTELLGAIASGPSYVYLPANTNVCLLLRPGVYLEMDKGVKLFLNSRLYNILGFKSMTSGGMIGGRLESIFDVNNPGGVGAGHGVFSYFTDSATDNPNYDLLFRDFEICNVSSYGLGLQHGFQKNVIIENGHIWNTGADALDWKIRMMADRTKPYGNRVEGLLAERYGARTGVTASAGADIRGPTQANNIICRDFAYGAGQTGIRLSAGIWNAGIDIRESSARSVLTNFQIDGGDAYAADTVGVTVFDSGGTVADGFITNCNLGVAVVNSSSGWGENAGTNIENVTVEGAELYAIQVASHRVSVDNCNMVGRTEIFESTKGNIIAGQTVFVSPRKFTPANLRVYKNDTLLTLTTDYTVTGDTTVTLVVAALITDVIRIVSATPEGIHATTSNWLQITDNQSIDVILERSLDSQTTQTLVARGNYDEVVAVLSEFSTSTAIVLQAVTSQANAEVDVRAKNDAGFTVRSRNARAFRAANGADNCVNWGQITGSVTGTRVTFSAAGSDTNIGIGILPKGTTGKVYIPIANVLNFANDAAAAAGGVAVGEIYRNGSIIMIRAA